MRRIAPCSWRLPLLGLLVLSAPALALGQRAKSPPPATSCADEPQRQEPSRKERPRKEPPREVQVTRVVDGDTLVLADGERVRVSGINAPEIDEELGKEAREFAVSLLRGKKATLSAASRDGYGRLVADVRVGGKSLSEELARAGLAHVYLIPPVDKPHAERLLAAEAQARGKKRGIWATARYRGFFHITSFHANPRGNESQDPNLEYVRIANVSGAPRSLKGHALVNRKGQRFAFPDLVVPPGHTVMVHSGTGTAATDPEAQLKLYWNRRFPAWANSGDTATLLGPDGSVVDEVVYDPAKKKEYPKDRLE